MEIVSTTSSSLPSWVVYFIDIFILMAVALGLAITILYKRSKYMKEAENCIRAEIEQPTGWTKYVTTVCDMNAKTITIDLFDYVLHPKKTRWGKHPRIPFAGITWLQVPIRVEKWFQDNPNPIQPPNPPEEEKYFVTAAEIKAISREMQAAEAGMEIQEAEARQKELTDTIARMPHKMIVYIALGACVIFSFIGLAIVAQLGGII